MEPIVNVSNNENLYYKVEDNVLIGMKGPAIYDTVNVGEMALEGLKMNPDLIGQIDGHTGKVTTCREMRENSVKCAVWLRRQGVGTGDVVAICTNNHVDVYIPCFAALYVGAALNPWDHEMTVASARRYLETISPKIVFANMSSSRTIREAIRLGPLPLEPRVVVFGDDDDDDDDIDEDEDREELSRILREERTSPQDIEDFRCASLPDPRHVALIIYSSGTTGMPKASVISHLTFANRALVNPTFHFDDYQVILWFSPMFWIAASYLMITGAIQQKTRVVCREFDEETALRMIEKYKVQGMLLGISMTHRLINYDTIESYDLSSVRKIIVGGAILRPEKQEKLREIFHNATVIQGYGMTECAGVLALQIADQKPGSNGYVASSVQLKIVDMETGATLGPNQTGEIYAKLEFMMTNYYKNPEGTKELFDPEGWLRTGDMGYWDDDGEIYVVGRLKELIKYRGYHVAPAEIEALLRTHPAVSEAVVVSVPHPIDEEHPIAFVVRRPGAQVNEEELCRLVEVNLHDNKRLRAGVRFVDEIPHTAVGKVARRQLQEMARQLVS